LKYDPDLMYSDEYVAAVWNPQPAGYSPNPVVHRRGFPWGTAFLFLVLLGAGGAVLWFVFMKPASTSGPPGAHASGPVTEATIYNPLSAKCGSFIAVDELDYRGKNYRVAEIQEYDHALGGKHFKLVNYVLQADKEVVRLRAVPSDGGFKVMLLNLYDDCAYNEGLHNVVRDDTLKFVVDDSDTGLHEEYWRVEDVRDSYKAAVTALRRDGAQSAPVASRYQLEYWDYWRDTEVDGVKVTQYLYVEMNTETGWFQIWRGMETDKERLLVT
jgi:hypothetical protein